MREAFGGGFMLKLLLIFIIIYVSLMAVAIKYAKNYRLKNYVINLVEQYQYSGDQVSNETIQSFLVDKNIEFANDSIRFDCESEKEAGGYTSIIEPYAVCIASRGDENDRYYKVITYVSIELPFFKFYWTLPVSGETSIIN